MKKWINFDYNGLAIPTYATTSVYALFLTWIVINAVMAIEIVILGNKGKKGVREAKVCRYCAGFLQTSA
jgi:hypothetical protein